MYREEQYMQSVFDQRDAASTDAEMLAAIRRLARRHVINARRAENMGRVWEESNRIARAHGMRDPDFGPADDPDMGAPAPDWPVVSAQITRAKKAAEIGRVCRWASRLAQADFDDVRSESPKSELIESAWAEITGSTSGCSDPKFGPKEIES